MPAPELPLLSPEQLRELAPAAGPPPGCNTCVALVCPGWESLPGGFDGGTLQRVGTLRVPAEDEPTLQEHHPAGTHQWSADAPISPAHFPYNRCDVWLCRQCHRAFLRYTEHGGYYNDERIRELDARLVVSP